VKRRIIIDTDPGIDDALAILLALASKELELEGLTVVFGNVEVEQGVRNALKILEIAGREDIPVFQGAARPLLPRAPRYAKHVHGEDGLGNTHLPPPKKKPAPGRAVDFIISSIMESPGEITLIPVGPLTNIALAVKVEPRIVQKVKEVIIMGGAVIERGNATPVAEANIHDDPEAAKIVFHAGFPLTMVGLDVTRKVMMSKEHVAQIERADGAVADFISAITSFYIAGYKEREGVEAFCAHDPSAVAYAIDPSLFFTRRLYVDVETKGERSYGQTIADMLGKWGCPPNINVCLDVDAERLLSLYVEKINAHFAVGKRPHVET